MVPNFSLFYSELALIVISLWLIVLSVLLFKSIRHYQRLTQGVGKKKLREILEDILSSQKVTEEETKKLVAKFEDHFEKSKKHLQKIGLVRYNPFSDTGGDQSFIIALLDDKNDGLVISSLHSREVTRIFAKPVKNGKGEHYELSAEEKKAIKKAS